MVLNDDINQNNDIQNDPSSQSQTKNNENEINRCKTELQQIKDTFLRINADFENYKKRVSKEKSEWISTAQANLILDLLPIIDDFDRAFEEYKKGEIKNIDVWISGFELIYKSFQKFLEKNGVKEITGQINFDPELHEAISQIDSTEYQSGQIVSILQKGYKFKDQILRPAKVIVAK